MTEPALDWLNDNSDYQRCFVCGTRNPFGLHLHFRTDGQRVLADFTGEERHQGFPGVVHGGILATLLDETMGRVPVLDRAWVMTGRLDLRFRLPAPVGVPLVITAEAIHIRPMAARIRGWISRADDPSASFCTAEGLFLPLPGEVRDEAVERFPGLAGYFMPPEATE